MKTYLKVEASAPLSSDNVIEQAELLVKLKPALDGLKEALPEGATVTAKISKERGALATPRKPRVAA